MRRQDELIREAGDRLREAEQELDAARTRSELSAAAKKLQRARAELKRLKAGEAGGAAEAASYPWFRVGGRLLSTWCSSSITKPDSSRCLITSSASCARASSDVCSVKIRRSSSRFRAIERPIEKASWSRNERWSTERVLVLFEPVIARCREGCQGGSGQVRLTQARRRSDPNPRIG
jgi:hypothetical protein